MLSFPGTGVLNKSIEHGKYGKMEYQMLILTGYKGHMSCLTTQTTWILSGVHVNEEHAISHTYIYTTVERISTYHKALKTNL